MSLNRYLRPGLGCRGLRLRSTKKIRRTRRGFYSTKEGWGKRNTGGTKNVLNWDSSLECRTTLYRYRVVCEGPWVGRVGGEERGYTARSGRGTGGG